MHAVHFCLFTERDLVFSTNLSFFSRDIFPNFSLGRGAGTRYILKLPGPWTAFWVVPASFHHWLGISCVTCRRQLTSCGSCSVTWRLSSGFVVNCRRTSARTKQRSSWTTVSRRSAPSSTVSWRLSRFFYCIYLTFTQNSYCYDF